jgi:hypothetical protein
MSELRSVEKDYSGKRLLPEGADAVIAELKKYLINMADHWLFKVRSTPIWLPAACLLLEHRLDSLRAKC